MTYERKLNEATNYIKKAFALRQDLETSFLYAEICIKQDLFEAARGLLVDCIKLAPHLGDLHLNLAKVYFKIGKLEQAIESINKAIGLEPERPEYYFHLGKFLIESGELKKARYCLEKVIAESPNALRPYKILINLLKREDEIEDAIDLARDVVSIYPQDSQLYFVLGNLYLEKKEIDLAKEQFRIALDLNPNKVISQKLSNLLRISNVHVFDNNVKVYEHHLLKGQLERYNQINLHEPEEENLFLEKLNNIAPGGCFLNIGSAIGYYSLLAKLKRKDIVVYAVEPLPLHRQYFKENIKLNGFRPTDFVVYDNCIGLKRGKGTFLARKYGSRLKNSTEINLPPLKKYTEKIEIDIIPLNFLIKKIKRNIDLLTIDVQGLELDVLKGGLTSFQNGLVKSLLLGTHSMEIHEKCIDFLKRVGMKIEIEIEKPDFQSDGIIVATKR